MLAKLVDALAAAELFAAAIAAITAAAVATAWAGLVV